MQASIVSYSTDNPRIGFHHVAVTRDFPVTKIEFDEFGTVRIWNGVGFVANHVNGTDQGSIVYQVEIKPNEA